MAVVGNLHKIVFGGSLATTETWSCSIHFLSPDSLDINSSLLFSAVEQWFERSTSRINGNARLLWLKANQIDPLTGLYTSQIEAHTHFYAPVISPSNVNLWGPPNTSFAVSTVTPLLRGLASKGRFFPPTNAQDIADDGRGSLAGVGGMATSAAQLLTDINGAASGSCVVFSKIGQLTTEMTGVRVGRVMDTQQRRRKNLIEEYVPAPIS